MKRRRRTLVAVVVVFALARVLTVETAQDATALAAVGVPPNDAICSLVNCPSLTNPQDPRSLGADNTGASDASAAFQRALDVGDLLVSPGTYLINHTVNISKGRHMRCQPDVLLRNTDPTFGFVFRISGGSGSSVVGCRFVGPQPAATKYWIERDEAAPGAPLRNPGGPGNGNCFPGEACTRHTQWNIAVSIQNENQTLVAGNSFDGFLGQSELQNYAPMAADNVGSQFLYNSFSNCGLYGGVFTQSLKGRLANNLYVDCSGGVEDDGPGLGGGENVLEHNVLIVINGVGHNERNGYIDTSGYRGGVPQAAIFTGGAAAAADYSSNIVRFNTVSGSYVWQGTTYRSRLWRDNNSPSRNANYVGNLCEKGCWYTTCPMDDRRVCTDGSGPGANAVNR